MAFRDISIYIKETYTSNEIKTYVGSATVDVWVVTPERIMTKETRKLNKQLGISNLNYYGNKNGVKKLNNSK